MKVEFFRSSPFFLASAEDILVIEIEVKVGGLLISVENIFDEEPIQNLVLAL